MGKFLILFLLSSAFILFSQALPASESLEAPHLRIDWLAPESFSVAEDSFVGIRFRPDPHWHVYWKNPGDSGAAPRFQITGVNAEVRGIQWPFPIRLPVAHLTNIGYEGEVAYLFKVRPTSPARIQIEADLEWLVCKEECVPGFGKLTLSRPAKSSPAVFQKTVRNKLSHFEQRLPSDGKLSPYRIDIKESAGTLQAILTSTADLPEKIDLLPVEPDYISPAPPKITKTDSAYEVVFQKSLSATKPPRLGFLLIADGKAYEFPDLTGTPQVANSPTGFLVFVLFLASAFVGGIILNLMPCVFPVTSIKAVSLLKTEKRSERHRDGIHYTLGVLTTFLSLGSGFLILRQLGSTVGWGFQLQSPLVIFALILLFWLMALNFLGVFEFGTSVMNSSGQLRWSSSFGTGVLSVFVAAPCTGPFMGTALGAAATLPSSQAILVFLFLGLGLALPYLFLSFSDRLARRMPKPGPWMETLKQFLAFPLFATILWLLWVLGQQTGTEGWFAAGISLFGISFSLWLGKRRKSFWKPAAWLLSTALVLYSSQIIRRSGPTESKESDWQNYSEEVLQVALEKNQPVFVDFTAAWCITCQVNKKAVLETARADDYFKKNGILCLKADWTSQDPMITRALAKLGRNSVPVYAFYPGKNAEVELLSQILTIKMIENLIPSKEEK